jgi:glycine betaine/choline ABC-type transport system substrate-binding protein
MKKGMKVSALAALALALLLLSAGCSKPEETKTVRIVHKNFTEQRLMGQVLSVYLEAKGFKTEVSELGGTMLCFNAVNNGDADMYAETPAPATWPFWADGDSPADETYDFVKTHF